MIKGEVWESVLKKAGGDKSSPGSSRTRGWWGRDRTLDSSAGPRAALAGSQASPARGQSRSFGIAAAVRVNLTHGPRRVWPPGSEGLRQLPPGWLGAREETGWGDGGRHMCYSLPPSGPFLGN